VSKIPCYIFDVTSNRSYSVSRSICLRTNYQHHYYEIYGRYGVSAMNSPEIVDKFDIACRIVSAMYDNLAISTGEEVEKVLARRDTSEFDLRASFRRALSFSIPPPTFYRNHCPSAHSNSDLIFGVPLVDLETNQDKVSKVMRICIEEVEKRGLNTKGIYSVSGQSCMY
jgi:hypothetical protein